MLVLTRKPGEKIIINGNIEVVVLEATKHNVRLGFEAPVDVQVYREEIYREIQSANKQSLVSGTVKVDTKGKFDLIAKFRGSGK